ncbi:uncharacterized protein LOC117927046 [Vitis riparia]|uniref:uncharacterized protein LOC117927046 n=1 Tax=Vitis riparia TaxID=96939 RepID=UPI00155A1E14|nr:uncharacterized protein LOC117927046 [Vitis riparia]
MGRSSRKMSLEEYFDFFESRNDTPLSVYNLNQIIAVHGFRHLYKARKQAMVDAVNTIELIDPCRSTLSQNTKSCAGMTLKQVISDLRDLNWQECCVTSLENISSSNSNYLAQESGLQNVELPKSKSRKKGSKSKTVDATTDNNDALFDGNSLSNSSVIGECPGKLVKKRKRKLKDKAGGDSAACSFGSC